jgi:hypothetical protein
MSKVLVFLSDNNAANFASVNGTLASVGLVKEKYFFDDSIKVDSGHRQLT